MVTISFVGRIINGEYKFVFVKDKPPKKPKSKPYRLIKESNERFYKKTFGTKKLKKRKSSWRFKRPFNILINPQKQRARKFPLIPNNIPRYYIIYRENFWRRWIHNLIRPIQIMEEDE